MKWSSQALKNHKGMSGKRHSFATRRRLSKIRKGINVGEESWNWKGDNVGYTALHNWVSRILGKPRKCNHCKTINARKYEWANISHKYKRELSDWIRLCSKCHRQYDKSPKGFFRNNTSGYKGVSWHKINKKWISGITINYKRIHLGYFEDKKEAVIAYKQAEKKYNYGK